MNHDHTSLMILLSLSAAFLQSLVLVKAFSLDLIHRDSPRSPLYNKSMSQSEILVRDAHRSHAQANKLRNSSSAYSKKLMMSALVNSGETYVTKYYLGSKGFGVEAFVSLATRVTWTKCFNLQEQGEQVFIWRKSDTFQRLSSNDTRCILFPLEKKDPDPNATDCEYKCLAGKGFYTDGVIARDKAYFHSSATEVAESGNILFGCSLRNKGFPREVQGVLGLSKGFTSVLFMLKEVTKKKFSYCLHPWNNEKAGVIKFGDIKSTIESKMTTVPFEKDLKYILSLEWARIGVVDTEKTLQLIQIDLGTTFTYLPQSIYKGIEMAVRNLFDTKTTPLAEYDICFLDNEANRKRLPSMTLTFYFRGDAKENAKYELNPSNIFVEDKQNKKFCLAIFESNKEISILGSKAQENHIMRFDAENNKLSFTGPGDDCNSFEQ